MTLGPISECVFVKPWSATAQASAQGPVVCACASADPVPELGVRVRSLVTETPCLGEPGCVSDHMLVHSFVISLVC